MGLSFFLIQKSFVYLVVSCFFLYFIVVLESPSPLRRGGEVNPSRNKWWWVSIKDPGLVVSSRPLRLYLHSSGKIYRQIYSTSFKLLAWKLSFVRSFPFWTRLRTFRSSTEFPNQNLRQIGPGVKELCSDFQTNMHTYILAWEPSVDQGIHSSSHRLPALGRFLPGK